MQLTIQLILEEHRALATVLLALRQAVDACCSSGAIPDFEGLRAMLFYLDEVPARVHHAALPCRDLRFVTAEWERFLPREPRWPASE